MYKVAARFVRDAFKLGLNAVESSSVIGLSLAAGMIVDNSNALFRIRAFYFLFYGAVGSIFPYLNLYYQRVGLSGRQIGTLSAVLALVTQLSAPLWGALGDARHLQGKLLVVAVAGMILVGVMLPLSSALSWLLLITAIYAFFFGPISPLVDSTALEVSAGDERGYGGLRAWGTVGFIVSALAVGRIIELVEVRALFAGFVLFMLGCLVLALRFPSRRLQWQGPVSHGFKVLLSSWPFLWFLVSAFLLAAAVRATNDFFALYLDSIGAPESVVGLSWAIAALTEVPVVFFSGKLLQRFSARRLFAFGSVIYALRWLLYSQVTLPGIVLLIQLLHGLSYGLYLVAGVVYTNERAPEGLGATAQGLYSGTTMGVAGIAGALAGGWLYDQLGVAALFRVGSLAAGLALVFLFISARTKVKVVS